MKNAKELTIDRGGWVGDPPPITVGVYYDNDDEVVFKIKTDYYHCLDINNQNERKTITEKINSTIRHHDENDYLTISVKFEVLERLYNNCNKSISSNEHMLIDLTIKHLINLVYPNNIKKSIYVSYRDTVIVKWLMRIIKEIDYSIQGLCLHNGVVMFMFDNGLVAFNNKLNQAMENAGSTDSREEIEFLIQELGVKTVEDTIKNTFEKLNWVNSVVQEFKE